MSSYCYSQSFASKEQSRIVYDEFIADFELIIGKVNKTKAFEAIEPHIHPNSFEIVYIVKGQQIYSIGDTPYTINSGECFITLPNELHSSGGYPQDKSTLYYAIIPVNLLAQLGFDQEESDALLAALSHPSQRIFIGTPQIPLILETLTSPPNLSDALYKTKTRQALTQLLLHILSIMHTECHRLDTPLTVVTNYIQENLTQAIAIKDLAQLVHLSESRFKTYFRQTIGIPPAEYILREKINFSKHLLQHTTLSITAIAFELSFSSSQYFSTVFKRFTTLSPAQYRLRYK